MLLVAITSHLPHPQIVSSCHADLRRVGEDWGGKSCSFLLCFLSYFIGIVFLLKENKLVLDTRADKIGFLERNVIS